MKKIFVPLFLLASTVIHAQDFLGLSTGNYAGITGVDVQPASIADSRYRFDINLSAVSFGFKSNFLGFSREFAIKNKFDFSDYNSYNDFKTNVLKFNGAAGNNNNFANVRNTVQIPVSFMLTTGKKSAVALNMRSRTMFAAQNVSYDFAKFAYDGFPFDTLGTSKSLTADNLSMRGVSYLDIGVTYARVLLNQNKHFVKGGVTGKYLAGISSVYLNADKLAVNSLNDVNNTINFNSGGTVVDYAHSATNFNVNPKGYKPDLSSFGYDAGLVYEFRGRVAKFKLGKLNGDGNIVSKLRRDKNKYSLRLGASLLNIGQLKFNSVADARPFTINKNIGFNNSGVKNIATFDSLIRNNVSYATGATAAYTMALPSALNVQADLHILSGLYINGMMHRPFTRFNADATYRTATPDFYAITPRFETRAFGVYVPLMLNRGDNQNDYTIGTTLRLGPVFVGTNKLSTLFKKSEINEADVHAGLKLPIGFGKPGKAFQQFNKLRKSLESKDNARVNQDNIGDAVALPEVKGVDLDTEAVEAAAEAVEAAAEAAVEEAENMVIEAAEPVAEEVIEVDMEDEDGKKVIEQVRRVGTPQAKGKGNSKSMNLNRANQGQPIKIIINNNNYNAPTKPGVDMEMDSNNPNDIQKQIQKLKKQIELKEKMLKELKKDNGTGCILKKKLLLA